MQFSTGDITKIVGIKRITLNDWINRGFVIPSIHRGKNPGDRHIWSRIDLYNIALFKKVVESGFQRKYAMQLIKSGVIDEQHTHEIFFVVFLRGGKRVEARTIWYEDEEDVSIDMMNLLENVDMLKKEHQFDDFYLVNFAKIRREIDARIESLYGDKKN